MKQTSIHNEYNFLSLVSQDPYKGLPLLLQWSLQANFLKKRGHKNPLTRG